MIGAKRFYSRYTTYFILRDILRAIYPKYHVSDSKYLDIPIAIVRG
jgi:hypothetical protein